MLYIIILIIILCIVLPIGFCLKTKVIGYQWITIDKNIDNDYIFNNTTNREFASFLSKFTPVKLPFIFRSKNIKFDKWEEIPSKYADHFLSKHDYYFLMHNSRQYISDDLEPNVNIFDKENIDILPSRYFYLIGFHKNYVAVIYIYKIYNDNSRSKATYAILTTFDKNGNTIDILKVGEALLLYNRKNKKILEHYTMTAIDKNFNISCKEVIWQFLDEGYGTSGYNIPKKYKIKDDGKIIQIDDIKIERDETKIKRDE